ncbi:MAG TPA: hypothetical protein VIJ70_05020 [Gaiellaceae bacterium]
MSGPPGPFVVPGAVADRYPPILGDRLAKEFFDRCEVMRVGSTEVFFAICYEHDNAARWVSPEFTLGIEKMPDGVLGIRILLHHCLDGWLSAIEDEEVAHSYSVLHDP